LMASSGSPIRRGAAPESPFSTGRRCSAPDLRRHVVGQGASGAETSHSIARPGRAPELPLGGPCLALSLGWCRMGSRWRDFPPGDRGLPERGRSPRRRQSGQLRRACSHGSQLARGTFSNERTRGRKSGPRTCWAGRTAMRLRDGQRVAQGVGRASRI
jgi:hypothetical protein